ncbi:MAG: DUF2202 domain-containing protein [Planctomycetota bacterium]
MKKSLSVCAVLCVLLAGCGVDQAYGQGRGGPHGGQRGGAGHGMRGGGGGYGLGAGSGVQSGAMRGKAMQQHRRWGQSQGKGRGGPVQTPCLGSSPRGWQSEISGPGPLIEPADFDPTDVTIGISAGATAELLGQAEAKHLLRMREEEKLARDVYLALGSQWPVPVFSNIARSETRHMAAVKGLLDRYGLEDPVADDTPGAFTDAELARLYKELLQKGRASAADAFRVGVTIEEMDIADLKEGIAATTHADIRTVYQNLLRASENHLRAFRR